jgi:ankyrin repeat protein
MKKIFTALLCAITLSAAAQQQNTLLGSSFWQSQPDVNAVKAEIAKGNSPSQFNAIEMDPVVMAINAQAPAETIKFLMEQPGNSVSKLTHDGRTYLHWAAQRGNIEVIEYLLSKGAKVNIMDTHGATPLLAAAGSGQQNTKIYDNFLAHGDNLKTNLSGDGANALLLAIPNDKDLALTNYFVSKGLDLKSTDAEGNNAFAYAAKSGNIDLMKTLQQKGVAVSPYALIMAAQGGRRGPGGNGGGANLAVYEFIESLSVKPTASNKNGNNVLHYLARKPGQAEIIQHFLSKGVDVNQPDEDGNTVLIDAASANRDTAVLAMLLAKIKNINQANPKGVTALAMAVRSNSAEVVSYLISHGASLSVVDRDGNNLAYYLVQSYSSRGGRGMGGAGNSPTVEFDAKLKVLQDKGFKVTTPQQNGNTLYHLAVAKNDLSLVKHLQPLGIDINARNKEGLTALHRAAMISKDDTIMKYLLSVGAQKEAQTNFKETAFDLAAENESLTKNNVSVNFLK